MRSMGARRICMLQWLKSLRARLMIAFLLSLLVPLLATVLYGQIFGRDVLAAQDIERSVQQVHLQAESIDSSLRQAQGDAEYVAALRSLSMLRRQTQPGEVARWQHEVEQDFVVLLSVRPMYHSLRYIDSDGIEVVAVTSDGSRVQLDDAGRDRRNNAYFHITKALVPGSVYVSSFARDQAADERGAPFIHYALHMADGEGVILIDLQANWLLRNLPAETDAHSWALIDQDGAYLVYPSGFDPAWFTDDLSPMLTGESGNFQTDQSVYVYETIYPTPSLSEQFWVIYGVTSKNILFENLQQFYLTATGFLLVGVGLAALVAFIMSRILARPLTRLETMAAAFGRDGKAPPLPALLPEDEIGSLTRTFCEMARELERKRALEHRLIERLIRAQEEERKLLAYDLHDGLIQQMVGARLYLTKCREHCPFPAAQAREGIMRGCDALTDAIVEGRRIIEGLRPAVLDDLGLVAAIEEVAQTSARSAGWDVRLALSNFELEPEKMVSVTLYRITQEALNNVRKHARAQHIDISLHNGHGISLQIADDGAGFDQAALGGEGHGLGVTTMQERAALIGGTCTIRSAPGRGTTIDVWVPSNIARNSGA